MNKIYEMVNNSNIKDVIPDDLFEVFLSVPTIGELATIGSNHIPIFNYSTKWCSRQ